MVTVQGEVEKKYVADDRFELPPLTELMAGAKGRRDGGVAPFVEGDPVRQRLEATYFDTADLRLASAGLTLRRRTGGDDAGWHLKVPAGTATRSEVRLPRGGSRRAARRARCRPSCRRWCGPRPSAPRCSRWRASPPSGPCTGWPTRPVGSW